MKWANFALILFTVLPNNSGEDLKKCLPGFLVLSLGLDEDALTKHSMDFSITYAIPV